MTAQIPAPVGCIEERPTTKTVQLAGVYISIRAIARATMMDAAYLSRTLSGKRDPGRMSINQAEKIAAALGMGLEALLDAIRARQTTLQDEHLVLRVQAERRARESHILSARKRRRGLPVLPDLPV